jgi:hypothetical protein
MFEAVADLNPSVSAAAGVAWRPFQRESIPPNVILIYVAGHLRSTGFFSVQ